MDFGDIRRRFDFRGIQVGRWVTREEMDRAAPLFYRALCDLMAILQGPETLISLRGTLALRYGVGGRPGVAAHYSPAERAFALAKNAGPGSIAHEWFHALDHYLAARAFADPPAGVFASALWLGGAEPRRHPLNDLLGQCFRAVLLDEGGAEPSDLVCASVAEDRARGTLYYSKPEELCARAFEAFVEDAPIPNGFLVKGTRQSAEARAGLYPRGTQRRRINAAFGSYFCRLGYALREGVSRS